MQFRNICAVLFSLPGPMPYAHVLLLAFALAALYTLFSDPLAFIRTVYTRIFSSERKQVCMYVCARLSVCARSSRLTLPPLTPPLTSAHR